MSTEPNNFKKIEAALNSLEGIQRAKAPAFFYTRLRSRMEQEFESGGMIGRLLTRPALALTVAAIVLVLNAAVIMQLWNQDPSLVNESTPIVAADYSIGTYPVYDENPVEP